MPHEDGPLYCPAVLILSLANPAVVRFARKRDTAAEPTGGCTGRRRLRALGLPVLAAVLHPSGQCGLSPSSTALACLGASCLPADAAAAAEGAESHLHRQAGQLVASVACMPRSLLIFR